MAISDDVNIECQYQYQSTGFLMCRLATLEHNFKTTEVTPTLCHECTIGKVYRDFGCKYISGKIGITRQLASSYENSFRLLPQLIWCKHKKRETDYQKCSSCTLVSSEPCEDVIQKTIGLFEVTGFDNAKVKLVEARKKLEENDIDGCIRSATVSLESALKSILDKIQKPYPRKEQLTDLYKSVKENLDLGDNQVAPCLKQILGSISGVVTNLAFLRNELSDVHGKGLISPELYESCGEIAINLSASMSTFLIRRSKELGVC